MRPMNISVKLKPPFLSFSQRSHDVHDLQLPTLEQCRTLSDEQCRRIQQHQDPDGTRTYKNWELSHQPELLRYYMSMLSFMQIEDAMKPELNWCYKTYYNRYREWRFPVDRLDRERVVRELYAWVTDHPESNFLNIIPSRPDQFDQKNHPHQRAETPFEIADICYSVEPEDRGSVSTTATSSSDGTKSSHGQSESTCLNSGPSSATSKSSLISDHAYFLLPSKPRHDPSAGLWNDVLAVVPCGQNHCSLLWNHSFYSCDICGFSRWHSLMIHARNVELHAFLDAMNNLKDVPRVDFAGNHPIHFLMCAGVSFEYFPMIFQWTEKLPQNVFGQNPLHVLNPLGLGDQLIGFLESFNGLEDDYGLTPSGLELSGLLTQRDIKCRTPLHSILRYPLDRAVYQKLFRVFPFAEYQLRSLDNTGRNAAVTIINESSKQINNESHVEYEMLQIGITEIKQYLSSWEGSSNKPRYGFHDIARGARGLSYDKNYYQCLICHQINAHQNSFLEQMICACAKVSDRNAPDETGMTPAHLLVTVSRYNIDRMPETPSQTADLFKVLIPNDNATLREALHVLDPNGNSLVFNIATRGLDEVLEYVLELEDKSRRCAMVNNCTSNGTSLSVLAAVEERICEAMRMIEEANPDENAVFRDHLIEKSNRLTRVKHILQREGAEVHPDITTQWRIS